VWPQGASHSFPALAFSPGQKTLPDVDMAPYAGVKYCYDVRTEEWRKSEVKLNITDSAIGQGAMRRAYHAAEMDRQGGSGVASVVKVFQNMPAKAAARACFDEAMTQMIAESYAQEFNRTCSKKKVAFLTVSVVQLQRPFMGATYACLEPLMEGRYVKHSDNYGGVATREELPQAFSHFTYENSNRLLVVCDIQGQGVDFFTDPQIHSYDGKSFGLGNLGERGIQKWKSTHRCNGLCTRLKLSPLTSSPRPVVAIRPAPVAVGGRAARGGRESDKEMAERLQVWVFLHSSEASLSAKPPLVPALALVLPPLSSSVV